MFYLQYLVIYLQRPQLAQQKRINDAAVRAGWCIFFKCPFCPLLFVARPSAPSGFRIIRPVNNDAMLVGWTLPEMDEFGRSNGLTVKGYKASIVFAFSSKHGECV